MEESGDKVVRIRCNICKEYKNLNADTYEKMIKRFGFTRSFIFGITHGIEAVITNQPIVDTISREETEKAFEKVYVCQSCKNNKKQTIQITQSLSRILNLKKETDKGETSE
jgi:hypothetical protein